LIDVSLDLREPANHLVGVTLEWTPTSNRNHLSLPGWTPGSYLIRDYVRHLEGLEVEQGGQRLQPQRTDVAAWELTLPSLDRLRVRYSILAADLSVRTCHLDADHGFLALAAVVLLVAGHRWCPWRLGLELPAGWQAFVPLPEVGRHTWQAGDFDQLVDSPIEVGPHPCHNFTVAGVPHRWVGWGGDLPALDSDWLADVNRICLACCRLMGTAAPAAEHYLFILHLREHGFGGLEHDCASVLMYGRRALLQPGGRRRLLQLVAHEYLHQWNVRRLRPAELTPYEYSNACIVPTLWFAEGVTSYYDQLLPVSAGLSCEDELLEDLGTDLSRYLLTPGRSVQSLRASSEEAWVKLYRQDAWSADSQISYYLKGQIIALILDLHLRRHGACLAEVLQTLWQRFGIHRRGYQEDDLIDAFSTVAPDLAMLLPAWLNDTEDPDLHPYLIEIGLRLHPQMASIASTGWCLEAHDRDGVRLSRVMRNGPAAQAGLQVGDEVLAVDGNRIRQIDALNHYLQLSESGKPLQGHLEILFCRDGSVRQTILRLAEAAIERWTLSPDPKADQQAIQRRQRWMNLEPEP
jgi:predicted metalloprotease with PDZ domain